MVSGVYRLVLRVTLSDFGKSLDVYLDVYVDDCVIDEINVVQPTTTQFVYDVLP